MQDHKYKLPNCLYKKHIKYLSTASAKVRLNSHPSMSGDTDMLHGDLYQIGVLSCSIRAYHLIAVLKRISIRQVYVEKVKLNPLIRPWVDT